MTPTPGLLRSASAPGLDANHTVVRSGYEAARKRLASGDYSAAHARTEQALRDLDSPHGQGAPRLALVELEREGEELLAKVVRACQAERSVRLARGEPAPVCPR